MENLMLVPKEIAQAIIKGTIARSKTTTMRLVLLSIFGGAFIGLGALGALTISQALGGIDPGVAKFAYAAVFPVGLMLIVLCGAELFTGNCLMTLALMDKKCGIKCVIRNWVLVYFGNFIGAILVAATIFGIGSVTGPLAEKITTLGVYKVGIPLGSIILSAILCNILVVLAVWMSTSAKDVAGKIAACWFPIMLFALSGYEHSIANMFILPLAKFAGAGITWSQIWFNNIIPVTIGNLIGGAIIVPVLYYLAYVKAPKENTQAENESKAA